MSGENVELAKAKARREINVKELTDGGTEDQQRSYSRHSHGGIHFWNTRDGSTPVFPSRHVITGRPVSSTNVAPRRVASRSSLARLSANRQRHYIRVTTSW